MKFKFLMIMKLACIIITAAILQVNAVAYGQQITLSEKGAPLREVFKLIETQSDYQFLYTAQMLKGEDHVYINIRNASIEEVLDKLLKGSDLQYNISKNTIVLKKKVISRRSATAAADSVRGQVTDSTGAPLPGVTVQVKGTSGGTSTDLEGRYEIDVASENAVLVFSYVGFINREELVGNRRTLDVVLKPDVATLDEVVVIGYGTQKKINLTGAVESISSEKIAWKPVGQTSMALQGLVPGLTVTQNSGQPGSNGGQIRIRGVGTLGNAGANPLVVIDGVATFGTNLNNLDPNDIENISILKDAASAAIYGSRAANGVILITTKRAKGQRISVEYDSQLGWQQPTNMPNLVSGLDHMLLLNEANRNMGQEETFSESYIEEYRQNAPSDLYPDTDWQDLTLTENGLFQKHSIAVSGGSDLIRIYGSLNYLNEKGLIPNTGYKRTSLRVNSDIQAMDNLNFRVDIRGSDELKYEPSGGINTIFHYLYGRVPANQEGLLSDGRYGQGWNGTNPIALANASGSTDGRYYRASINIEGEWQPVEGLNISLLYAPEFYIGNNKSFRRSIDTYYGDGSLAFVNAPTNSLNQSNTHRKTDNLRGLIRYTTDINQHGISALVGYEQQESYLETFNGRRENFLFEDYPQLSLGSEENQTTEGSANEFALQSVFGRISYNYNSKYLLEGNIRYDGSSRFGKDSRFGLFPSFSAGWRISQEDFMDNSEFIDDLKLRVSWGQLGNQEIGNYPFASTANLSQGYIINESPVDGAALSALGNPGLSWETTEMFNAGIDLGIFSKLMITSDFYIKDTRDILLRLPIPATVGRTAPYQNAGEVRNVGWELSVNHFNTIEDFSYDITFSLADVKNEIRDLKDTGPYIGGNTIRAVGYPIDAFYGYETDGLFQTQDEVDSHASQFGGRVSPGDIKYVDQNGDGVINADDRVILGSNIPRYTFSLGLSASYKNFDVRAFFQGVGKSEAYLAGSGVWAFYVGATATERHMDRWTPDNPDASYPRLTFNYSNNEQVSDFWILNAAYLRLKNLNVGYTLPNRIVDEIGINNVRFFFNGQNLFTIEDFINGFDVEAPVSSVDSESRVGSSGFYPMVRTYMFGVNVSF